MAIFITFQMVNVNSLNTQAGVFIGNNNQLGWDANGKISMGAGQVMGIYQVATTGLYVVNDNDYIDSPIVETQIKGGNTLQGL